MEEGRGGEGRGGEGEGKEGRGEERGEGEGRGREGEGRGGEGGERQEIGMGKGQSGEDNAMSTAETSIPRITCLERASTVSIIISDWRFPDALCV